MLQRTVRGLLPKRCSSYRCYSSTSETEQSSDLVTKKRFRDVCIIGINRPLKRNCVNFETAQKLREIFQDFEKDESANVAVLHGYGGNFCAGYDLSEITQENVQRLEDDLLLSGPMGPTRMLSSKPVVAAVDGYAVAGGLELCLMCDLRVVEETASLGVLCRRFGVPLVDGGTVRLPKLIGLSRALDLILTGRLITAKEALEYGLANRVVACGTALGGAISLAQSIAKFPQKCLLTDRASAYHSSYNSESLQKALEYEAVNAKPVVSAESITGAGQFMKGHGRGGKFNLEIERKTDKNYE